MKIDYDFSLLQSRIEPICHKLMAQIDNAVRTALNCAGRVDVSELVTAFRHLTLKKEYRLIAYAINEYHGTMGFVVAMRGDREIPDILMSKPNCIFEFKTPPSAEKICDAVECDGTAEGRLEFILFNEFLYNLPWLCDFPVGYDILLSDEQLNTEYEFLVKPQEWSIQYIEEKYSSTIILFKYCANDISICSYCFGLKVVRFYELTKRAKELLLKNPPNNERSCNYESQKMRIAIRKDINSSCDVL